MVNREPELTQEVIDYWEAQIDPPIQADRHEIPFDPAVMGFLFTRMAPGGRHHESGVFVDEHGEKRRIFDPVNLADPDDPVVALVENQHESAADELELVARRYLRRLPALERAVLRLRHGFDGPALTQQAIADTLGMSRAGVIGIEQRALARLRDYERAQEDRDAA